MIAGSPYAPKALLAADCAIPAAEPRVFASTASTPITYLASPEEERRLPVSRFPRGLCRGQLIRAPDGDPDRTRRSAARRRRAGPGGRGAAPAPRRRLDRERRHGDLSRTVFFARSRIHQPFLRHRPSDASSPGQDLDRWGPGDQGRSCQHGMSSGARVRSSGVRCSLGGARQSPPRGVRSITSLLSGTFARPGLSSRCFTATNTPMWSRTDDAPVNQRVRAQPSCPITALAASSSAPILTGPRIVTRCRRDAPPLSATLPPVLAGPPGMALVAREPARTGISRGEYASRPSLCKAGRRAPARQCQWRGRGRAPACGGAGVARVSSGPVGCP